MTNDLEPLEHLDLMPEPEPIEIVEHHGTPTRDLAMLALSRQASHDAVCGERYVVINRFMKIVDRRLEKLSGRWWWLLTGIISVEGLAIAWLVTTTGIFEK